MGSLPQILNYTQLSGQIGLIKKLLHDYGFIALSDVPGFAEVYEAFLSSAKKFMALSEEEKERCSPSNKYTRGWSYGIEGFKGELDAYKGSYYAMIPEERALTPNIWPQDPAFHTTYVKLAFLIYRCGIEILNLLKLPSRDLLGLGRMVYYSPLGSSESSSPYWCGSHRDHGLLTGLCPGVMFKEGVHVPRPQGTGLFVQGREVDVPSDALLIQVGEATELVSNGAYRATEHHVRKAYGEYERYAFALFFDPPPETVIQSPLTTYNDRYKPGMTYGEWAKASYEKFNLSKEE